MVDLGEITRFIEIDIRKVKSSHVPRRFDYVISQENYLAQVIQRYDSRGLHLATKPLATSVDHFGPDYAEQQLDENGLVA